MAIEFEKQPAESRLYNFDYTAGLTTGETIQSSNPIAQLNMGKVSGSAALTIGTVSVADTYVQARISGGTANENYKVTALVTTSLSNILELDGILNVRDD